MAGEAEPVATELLAVSHFVDQTPECLASGSADLRTAALDAVKFVFDLGQFYNIS